MDGFKRKFIFLYKALCDITGQTPVKHPSLWTCKRTGDWKYWITFVELQVLDPGVLWASHVESLQHIQHHIRRKWTRLQFRLLSCLSNLQLHPPSPRKHIPPLIHTRPLFQFTQFHLNLHLLLQIIQFVRQHVTALNRNN